MIILAQGPLADRKETINMCPSKICKLIDCLANVQILRNGGRRVGEGEKWGKEKG